jgi:hypothetical protein
MDDQEANEFFDSEERKHFHLVIQTFLNYEYVLLVCSLSLSLSF